jgi:hypothetical protein
MIILDMMVYNFNGKYSLQERNLNNFNLICCRMIKPQTEYIQSSNPPFCPTHTKSQRSSKIVHGNHGGHAPNGSIKQNYVHMEGV